MNRTLARVQRVAEEMKSIQTELFATGLAKDGQSPAFLDDPECLEVLSEFKARVDDLRRLIFFFVTRLSEKAAREQKKSAP